MASITLIATAQPAPSSIRVGIAGWSNPPTMRSARSAGQTHLSLYAQHFPCVEINSTFYRPHRTATYERWRDETPTPFRFTVKMPRDITHDHGLKGTRSHVHRFYEEIHHLQPKLLGILVQLPPSLEFCAGTVRSFFRGLPQLTGVSVACEPRHASWFSKSADDTLRRLGIARVAADPARGPGSDVPGGALGFRYFRWHGSPRMYYSAYSDAQLAGLADRILQSSCGETCCIFDNTAHYAAWNDARRLLSTLA
jgi:uncharacterized protein YecE (DUF72 family)